MKIGWLELQFHDKDKQVLQQKINGNKERKNSCQKKGRESLSGKRTERQATPKKKKDGNPNDDHRQGEISSRSLAAKD